MISDTQKAILIVDDDQQVLTSTTAILRSAGFKNIQTISDSRQVMPFLYQHDMSVVILDLIMEHISGARLLERINSEFPHLPVIVLTAMNEIGIAVECMRAGAFDYIVKPFEKSQLLSRIGKAIEMSLLKNEITSLKQRLFTDELVHEKAFAPIVTDSKKMRAVFQYIEVIAKSNQPVLITGDTGVGKDLVARAIHDVSERKGDFIDVNIAGLDDTVFSDTLFGHKKGAFTGADHDREGLIAKASEGTLFLDEIGDLKEASQIKLLRMIQGRTYYPLGSDIAKQSDARIIVATNRDLQKAISEGKFRNDLYYRLRAHQIHIPSLKERLEDIPVLVDHFLDISSRSLSKKKPTVPDELYMLLRSYHFPGNVRELAAMIYDAVARHSGGILSIQSFRDTIASDAIIQHPKLDVGFRLDSKDFVALFGKFPTLRETTNFLIDEAMKISNDNQGIAASLLGITRQALNKRLNRKE